MALVPEPILPPGVSRTEFRPTAPVLFDAFERARLPSQDAPAEAAAAAPSLTAWRRLRAKLGSIRRRLAGMR